MITKEEMVVFFDREFPKADFIIESVGNKSATLRKPVNDNHLRPGGTVAGPVLMGLADVALYVAIMGEIGFVTMAVTTNLNVNFLRKPESGKDLIAKCTMIKMGKLLAVGEVSIYSDGLDDPVVHAVGTYAIPSFSNSTVSDASASKASK